VVKDSRNQEDSWEGTPLFEYSDTLLRAYQETKITANDNDGPHPLAAAVYQETIIVTYFKKNNN
jgi:hypothetical protein